LFQFFQSQRHFAEEIGEWAFYAMVLLIALALIKRFPYRYFFKTHRLLAIASGAGIPFHGIDEVHLLGSPDRAADGSLMAVAPSLH
jgi:predicted ferric reductase